MDRIHSDNYRQGFSDYAFEDSASSVFIVGAVSNALLEPPQSLDGVERLASLREAETLAVAAAFGKPITLILDLALLDQPVEECLGRVVRSFPHRVILHCITPLEDSQWSDNAFFAFGFQKVLQMLPSDLPPDLQSTLPSELKGQKIRWFEYRMTTYKPAPDWLNARFWANPERFETSEDADLYCDEEE